MSDREYPTRPFVGIGIVVIKGGHVLLCRRAKPPAVGSWTLPGGAQDVGETCEQAARRALARERSVSYYQSDFTVGLTYQQVICCAQSGRKAEKSVWIGVASRNPSAPGSTVPRQKSRIGAPKGDALFEMPLSQAVSREARRYQLRLSALQYGDF